MSEAPTYDRPLMRRRLTELIHQIDVDEQCRRRAIQQAILEAEAWWWSWRAEQFHSVGNAECDMTALACRRKAAFLVWDAEGGDLVDVDIR